MYERNLATAMRLGDQIIARYKAYLDYINSDTIQCMASCRGEEYFMGEVLLDKKIRFKKEGVDYSFDPKQLFIEFDKDFSYGPKEFIEGLKNKAATIEGGICDYCGTLHIRCECGEEHAVYDKYLLCGCGQKYDFLDRTIIRQIDTTLSS